MSEWTKASRMSMQDYLVSEVRSPARREYVAGSAYAMSGARNVHNQIATNALIALGLRLRGTGCRPFNSDTRVRVRLPWDVRFYYPDAMVTCRPNPPQDVFQDEPCVIVEVLSPETRRIDEGEKLLAYQSIPALQAYLLVAQDAAKVVVFRRTDQGFERHVFAGLAGSVPLPEIGCELPLTEVYDGVAFDE